MTDENASEPFEEGRYLYCAVSVDDPSASFETEGLDDEPVYLVAVEDVGAVVHRCESVFDADDPRTVKRWLLDHQRVVDAAGEAFDTPLPFRFDTILKGDDETVRGWLRRERRDLSAALDSVAGQWEYRIELADEEPASAEELEAEDERLRELATRRDDAGEGEAFLREKQYEKRLRELRRARASERFAELESRLAELATDVQQVDSSSALADRTGEENRLTILAPADREEAIGELLESIAAEGLEVRFTGPWPPYSFAPAFGGES